MVDGPAPPARRAGTPGDAAAQPPPTATLDGARVAALHDLGLLDVAASEEFDRYTRLASRLLGAPVSLLALVDAERQFFLSAVGLPEPVDSARQTPLSHSFCRHIVDAGAPLVVSDARLHPVLSGNLAVRDQGIVAYAGMPLMLADGHVVGTLCAVDTVVREWTDEQVAVLRELAGAAASHLELRRSLNERSLHDRLTGLPNRALLGAQAGLLLDGAGPQDADSVAAVCVGLDDLADVNDAFGPGAGDDVLRQVAGRLGEAVRDADVVGRFGGDAFATIGGDLPGPDAALELGRRQRACVVREPVQVDGRAIGVSVAVGVARGAAGETGAALLSRAHEAMRRSRADGGALVASPTPVGALAAERVRLRTAIGGALARDELGVAYQPIVDLRSGTAAGCEALVRWYSPELGHVSPADFVPVAERTGDIVPMGEWVLGRACAEAAAWRAGGLSVSVNLAPAQLELAGIAGSVAAVLEAEGLAATSLVLEITERTLLRNDALVRRNLDELRDLGVRIALDDFGTGWSALGYLRRFPIDELKIDRSFVDGLERDREAPAVVRAILALAHGLGLEVVAEGIETAAQHEILRDFGCRLGQGFLFARPGPARDLPAAFAA